MSIYKYCDNNITALNITKFQEENILEEDIKKAIIENVDVIEENLFVLCEEYSDWEDSNRRIDILCIDKEANLVVVELKRTERGEHMELQALRYAAMVNPMTFENAVQAHSRFLNKIKSKKNAEAEILKFLAWEEVERDKFGIDVRIILVSSDFSKEITTTVLWLVEKGIDIKCVRLKPQKDGKNVYLDIQQIIPLPLVSEYQTRIKEKKDEQISYSKKSRKKDLTFELEGEFYTLPRRHAIYLVVKRYIEITNNIEKIIAITGDNYWVWSDMECKSREEFEKSNLYRVKYKQIVIEDSFDTSRWFVESNELFLINGKTYAFSNQHGEDTLKLIREIFNSESDTLKGSIE